MITHHLYLTNLSLKLLEEESNKLYRWYELDRLKPNMDKYHLLLSSHDMNLELTINAVYCEKQ